MVSTVSPALSRDNIKRGWNLLITIYSDGSIQGEVQVAPHTIGLCIKPAGYHFGACRCLIWQELRGVKFVDVCSTLLELLPNRTFLLDNDVLFCRTLDSFHIRTRPKRSGVIKWCWSWDHPWYRYQTLNACGWRRSLRTFYTQLSIPNPSVFFHMIYEVRK